MNMLVRPMKRALFIMILAMTLIPAGDAASKLLTGSYAVIPIFVAWARFVVGLIGMAPFVKRSDLHVLASKMVIARASLLALGVCSITMALKTEPIANVFGAFFVAPLVSYALAVVILKEHVTPSRTLLIIIGFVGVMCITQPSFQMSTGMIFALCAGIFYGAFLTISRIAAQRFAPIPLGFSQYAINTILLAPFAIFHIPEVSLGITILLAISGFASLGGNVLLLYANQITQATRLAPFVYIQLIAALGLGWLIFGQNPDLWGLIGIVLIVASGFATGLLRR